MLDTTEILNLAEKKFIDHKGVLRRGQCYMNVLASLDIGLYELITDTPFDCFYDDKKIGLFIAALLLPQEVRIASQAFGFMIYPDILANGNVAWYVWADELNCTFRWSSQSTTDKFFEQAKAYFLELGFEQKHFQST